MSDYDRLTVDSPSPVARFNHRTRFDRTARLIEELADKNASVLDYGCGDGRLLSDLRARGWQGALLGYDAFVDDQKPGFEKIADLDAVADASLDIIGAFEALEHMDDEARAEFLEFCARALKPSGRIVVSVPIMIGPVLFLKYANARIVNGSPWRYSPGELIRAGIFWGSVPRSKSGKYMDHKGFDYRELKREIAARFKFVRSFFSPFPALGAAFNSQIFMVFADADQLTEIAARTLS
ncbi:MAG: class I SAM-dependent methyltransferase [Hyphomonadaceae bacterium]